MKSKKAKVDIDLRGMSTRQLWMLADLKGLYVVIDKSKIKYCIPERPPKVGQAIKRSKNTKLLLAIVTELSERDDWRNVFDDLHRAGAL